MVALSVVNYMAWMNLKMGRNFQVVFVALVVSERGRWEIIRAFISENIGVGGCGPSNGTTLTS